MTNPWPKQILFHLIAAGLLFGILELCVLAMYLANPLSMFVRQSYDIALSGAVLGQGDSGWQSYEGQPRPSSHRRSRKCAATFGDSFTHADEVDHDHSWAHIASGMLNCDLANYGVGGYGVDQAYLRYLEVKPAASVIILGLYPEMLRRNFAASWLFYAPQDKATLKPMFTVAGEDIQRVPPPEDASREEIRRYHANDRFYAAYRIGFPYVGSVAKVACFRFEAGDSDEIVRFRRFIRNRVHDLCRTLNGRSYRDQFLLSPFENDEAVQLNSTIVEKLRTAVTAHGKSFAILLFPSPEQAKDAQYPYAGYMQKYRRDHPGDCVIDVGPAIHAQSTAVGQVLRAPQGHYNEQGNAIIAKEVVRALRECNLLGRDQM